MAVDQANKRKRGIIAGVAMIALGLITAVIGYFSDSESLDFIRMVNATD